MLPPFVGPVSLSSFSTAKPRDKWVSARARGAGAARASTDTLQSPPPSPELQRGLLWVRPGAGAVSVPMQRSGQSFRPHLPAHLALAVPLAATTAGRREPIRGLVPGLAAANATAPRQLLAFASGFAAACTITGMVGATLLWAVAGQDAACVPTLRTCGGAVLCVTPMLALAAGLACAALQRQTTAAATGGPTRRA